MRKITQSLHPCLAATHVGGIPLNTIRGDFFLKRIGFTFVILADVGRLRLLHATCYVFCDVVRWVRESLTHPNPLLPKRGKESPKAWNVPDVGRRTSDAGRLRLLHATCYVFCDVVRWIRESLTRPNPLLPKRGNNDVGRYVRDRTLWTLGTLSTFI
ncbi:MAG: hypothetical protein BWY14_00990 [Parcubacteria group bacterium ADurb.Bin192]|nr:MAG: hypothetical protein BWY14_00990 [Parcubacteria group bacterium ADurb.Bin192]